MTAQSPQPGPPVSDRAPPIARMVPRVTLHNEAHRRRALKMVAEAPLGCRVTLAEPKRSDAQNDKMWAMIDDVMEQWPDWFGPRLDKDEIKQVFMSSLFKELKMARNADGNGYIPLSHRSSKLSVREMANLISLIDAWGGNSEHLVVWSDPKERLAA